MVCSKTSFKTKEEADERIFQINLDEIDSRKPIRSYLCSKCKFFHLTSWSKRLKKRVNKIVRIRKEKRVNQEADFWIKKINGSKR